MLKSGIVVLSKKVRVVISLNFLVTRIIKFHFVLIIFSTVDTGMKQSTPTTCLYDTSQMSTSTASGELLVFSLQKFSKKTVKIYFRKIIFYS